MVRSASAQPAEVDEDFEREFAQLLLDGQGRPAAPAGGGGGGPIGAHASGQGKAPAVAFKVVMRRGGREDRTRELHIPLSAGMAAHLREKEEREAAEKAELKRLVLAANSHDAQAEHDAVVAALLQRRRGPYGGRSGGGRGGG